MPHFSKRGGTAGAEEGYVMIEIRPEGGIDGLGSDITLNRRDVRSKFGYTTLSEIGLRGGREENIFKIRNNQL